MKAAYKTHFVNMLKAAIESGHTPVLYMCCNQQLGLERLQLEVPGCLFEPVDGGIMVYPRKKQQ